MEHGFRVARIDVALVDGVRQVIRRAGQQPQTAEVLAGLDHPARRVAQGNLGLHHAQLPALLEIAGQVGRQRDHVGGSASQAQQDTGAAPRRPRPPPGPARSSCARRQGRRVLVAVDDELVSRRADAEAGIARHIEGGRPLMAALARVVLAAAPPRAGSARMLKLAPVAAPMNAPRARRPGWTKLSSVCRGVRPATSAGAAAMGSAEHAARHLGSAIRA